jgi:hypothetical protein
MIPLASDLLPFQKANAVGRPFGVASRQTGFSSSGRIVIVGPIHRKCPGVVVVAVDKIAERCKEATESLSSDRSRENAEEPATRAMPLYEVIVVGLGAVGSAATWHLARLGTKVLGIDRYKPPHEFGSSTGETRLTRVAVGEGVEYSPLALRSNEIWREIEAATGQTLFVQCGCLTITGHPNKSMARGVNKFFDNIAASAERYNIPHEIFGSADALRSRFPQFAVNGTEVGFLDKGGGYLFVEACIRTQLRSAEDCGAELKFGEKVVTFNSSAFGVTVTTDSGERYDAEKLLLAVGAWMPGFLPERLRQYFSVTRQFLHWFEIRTNRLENSRSVLVRLRGLEGVSRKYLHIHLNLMRAVTVVCSGASLSPWTKPFAKSSRRRV